MTAEPVAFDAVFDDAGRLRVPEDAAARLSEELGRRPEPGDVVHVSVVPQRPRPRRSSYGRLRHLAPTLGKVDVSAIRRELTAELDDNT